MNIITTYSDLNFFLSVPVVLRIVPEEDDHFQETEITVTLPTVYDIEFNNNFRLFFSFLNTDIETLQKTFVIFPDLSTHLDLINRMLLMESTCQEYINFIIAGCETLNCNITIVNHTFMINNTIPLEYNLFQELVHIVNMACGIKHTKETDNARLNAYNKRIEKIKNQNKMQGDALNSNDIIDTMVILMYEFNLTKDDILHSTLFFLQTLASYYSILVQHQVSLIGAGNGLAKKIYNISKRRQ